MFHVVIEDIDTQSIMFIFDAKGNVIKVEVKQHKNDVSLHSTMWKKQYNVTNNPKVTTKDFVKKYVENVFS